MVFVKILKGLIAVATVFLYIYFVFFNTFNSESHSFNDTIQSSLSLFPYPHCICSQEGKNLPGMLSGDWNLGLPYITGGQRTIPTDLRCTLNWAMLHPKLSYAAPYWATLHPELSYAAPYWATLHPELSYAAPYWATVHPELSYAASYLATLQDSGWMPGGAAGGRMTAGTPWWGPKAVICGRSIF